jgi:hypothetical protein
MLRQAALPHDGEPVCKVYAEDLHPCADCEIPDKCDFIAGHTDTTLAVRGGHDDVSHLHNMIDYVVCAWCKKTWDVLIEVDGNTATFTYSNERMHGE